MKKILTISILFLAIFNVDIVNATNTVSCGGVENIPAGLPKFISNIINLIKIATPILLIVMGMLDFFKSMTANDDKAVNEGKTKFIKRTVSGVLVFLIVSIVQLVFNAIGTNDTNTMATCINLFVNGETPLTTCMKNSHEKCSNACYNVAGSHSSEIFYKCVNDCESSNNNACKAKYRESNTVVEVCLQCNSHSNVYKWDKETNTSSDEKCPSGYRLSEITSKNQCVGSTSNSTSSGNSTSTSTNSSTTSGDMTIKYSHLLADKECSEYPTESSCPKIDKNGKLCEFKNNHCTNGGLAQECDGKYKIRTTCNNSVDDFGNNCIWSNGKCNIEK